MAILLSACASKSSDPSATSVASPATITPASTQAPVVPPADDGIDPAAPVIPVAPIQASPPLMQPPVATNLHCTLVGINVVCTGSNLNGAVLQLDINEMFTWPGKTQIVNIVSVLNNVSAKNSIIDVSHPGNDTCIIVMVKAIGTAGSGSKAQICGDFVDVQTNLLEFL